MGRRQGARGRWAAVAALVGGLVVTAGSGADAADVVVCDGGDAHVATIAHTRIDGDLHVAPGTTCVLDHVAVTGRLVVPASVGELDWTAASLTSSEVRAPRR